MLEYFENQVKFIDDFGFTDKKIKQYFIADNHFHKFLNIDDANLYNFYNGFDTEFEIEKTNISLLFKNFKY